MALSLWALAAYIAIILVWNVVLKRNIGEAMGIGWIVVLLFGGSGIFDLFLKSMVFASTTETVYAAQAFVFMAYVMTKTGLVNRLVDILNSALGKLAGGAGYIATCASALMGLISGSGSGNAASVGAVAIPWMQKSNWPKDLPATVIAGNAGLGADLPPSSSMFVLAGMAVVAAQVNMGQLYMALLTGGAWTFVYRIILIYYFVKKYNIKPVPPELIKPFMETMKNGWTSLLMFLGILIPVGLTMGPVGEYLESVKSFGSNAVNSLSIIVWIPVLISWIAILEGWKYLPKSASGWYDFIGGAATRYVIVGATIFFAMGAGDVLTRLGLAEDMLTLMQSFNFSPWLMISLVGILVCIVGGPLTSTATVVAVGPVSFSALVSVGVPGPTAAAVILIWAATEGASPPNSAPIFIASGIANTDPVKVFVPCILYYLLPLWIIGILIALRILPSVVL
ncbi:MAG TPA: TRAP transporter large permease subunit [Nitrospirota bacterium]|nr:TRAP transporter large permease subunit [Nitrospirota bacterium]